MIIRVMEIGRVDSNWRGEPAWRERHGWSWRSNQSRLSFQWPLQACQLITWYGEVKSFGGRMEPLIGAQADQTDDDGRLLSPAARPDQSAAADRF
jgi:hypothetical protein